MQPSDNTPELLQRFLADRSEAAFRQLIETHTGMVLAVARRKLNGNEAEAREVTQTVFAELARRAASLRRDIVLGAWLHRVTCTQAAMLIRSETRRRKHEANAAAMIAIEQSGEEDAGWTEMSPVLDDELNRLSSPDREALVLRFFEKRGLREVGAALGTTEEGARKRVSRALEKLRRRFVRRGLTVPGAGGLAVLLTSSASEAAAPEVTGIIARAALTQSAAVPAGFASGAAAAFVLKGLSAAAQAIADDPAKGFSLSAQYRSPWLHFHNWRAFRSMWEHQPAAFTREVFGRTQPSLRDSLTLAAIDSAKAWATADTTGFSAWAVKEFGSEERELHRELDHARLFEILMEHDPEAAGRVFASSKPSLLRNKMQALYVSHIAAADPQQAAQWIDDNVTEGRAAAFTAWAEASAKAVGHKQAAVLALSLPAGVARDAAAEAALSAWADDDVNSAVAWAKAQPASEGENAPVTHMTYAWLKYHASEASRYIMEHPDLGWSPSIFLNATRNLPFAEAVGLIKSLPDQHAETSLKMLSERLANGSNKVREIASLPPERQAIAVRSAAEEIAYTDPKRAATWVAALPAGPLRAAGEEGLAGR